MLQGISKAVISAMPAASTGCYITAAFLGRKFCLAAGYKVGGVVADLMGKNNVAKWNKASQQYLTIAKKDAVRDLTALVGFVAMGFAASCVGAGKLPVKEEPTLKPTEPAEPLSYSETIKNGLYDWSRPLIATGIGGGILVIDRMRYNYWSNRDRHVMTLTQFTLNKIMTLILNRSANEDIAKLSDTIINKLGPYETITSLSKNTNLKYYSTQILKLVNPKDTADYLNTLNGYTVRQGY